jgi:PHD/YefM family antitoxin component YafN of YafNO toxin-antitoxin module
MGKGSTMAIIASEDEWDSEQETRYLLSSSANAESLLGSLTEVGRGEFHERELVGFCHYPDGYLDEIRDGWPE